jgi:hypothetical protein
MITLFMISHCHDITEILLKLVLKEAGQIGPKPNRPKVKSAPSQIGPSQIGLKSNLPQVKSAPVKSAPSQIGPIFVVYYCQHAKLNSLNTIPQNI